MNKKSKAFEKTVIQLFLTEKLNRSEISRMLKCSMFTVSRILNDYKIDVEHNMGSSYDKHYSEISDFFNTINDLGETLKKFNRYKSIVYDFICKVQDIKINDTLIASLFITTDSLSQTKYIAKSTIKYFTDHCNSNAFLKRVVDYLSSRYSDSKSISETIARIYNGIDVRPVCKQCGKHLTYCSLNKPFPLFCSRMCSNSNDDTKLHLKQTCLKKYGVTSSAKAESTKQHYKDHMEQKYGIGITNAWQADEVIEKSRQTKLSRYGSKTYNNRCKAEQTCLEKYGVAVSSQDQKIKDKIIDSQNIVFLDKYGAKRPFQNAEIFHNFQQSMLKKFGSTNYLNSLSFQDKCLEKYGCRNPMQNQEIRKRQQYRYTYDGKPFDSAPEVAFYIWLTDVKDIIGIDFEYSPDISLKYEHKGETHFYMPDFRIGSQLFEIKGDHFFKDDRMINPYRKKEWSDETYRKICDRYEAKRQCMLRNGVIILKNAEYVFFTRYVDDTYGKGFLSRLKNAKNVNIQKAYNGN